MSEGREPLRLVRGALAATLATSIALLGHVLGGGDVPGWMGIALPWWLSITLCTTLAGARFSAPRLLAAISGSQLLFHLLFVVGAPSSGAVTLSDAPGMHLHLGVGSAAAAAAQTGAPATSMTHLAHSAHLSGPMLLAHLLAAAGTAAMIHRGEAVLLRAIGLALSAAEALLRRRGPRAARLVSPPARPRPVPPIAHLPRRRRALLRPLTRRGPPLLLAI
ncbi:hypothetical protein [Brachybacterium hainanense]|uniref:Integral membrane protein n=1 Tax=Brachybacterium hainanense TaxID=1541174 RepID=A0ABV6R9I8_9MICO